MIVAPAPPPFDWDELPSVNGLETVAAWAEERAAPMLGSADVGVADLGLDVALAAQWIRTLVEQALDWEGEKDAYALAKFMEGTSTDATD